MGTVRKVDTSGSRDCIGRFLRVKISFNVHEPFIRGTFVKFPNDGKVWVDFKYESLPKYCLICGMLGHPTRVCKDIQNSGRADGDGLGDQDDTPSFRGLETDLRGKPLGSSSRSKVSVGSNGVRKSAWRWREDQSDDWEGIQKSI